MFPHVFSGIRNLPRHWNAKCRARRMQSMQNREPLISFSFDDFPSSAWTHGGEILGRYEVMATYFISLGLLGRKDSSVGPLCTREELQAVTAAGHEAGCHTFDHSDAWICRAGAYEESVCRNAAGLSDLIPGRCFSSFAYPKGRATPPVKRAVGRHFACCRGNYPGLNQGNIDLNLLRAVAVYGDGESLDGLRKMILANREASGWLIFYTHDVSEEPSPFGCTRKLFEQVVKTAVESGARVLPVAQALNLVTAGPPHLGE